MDYARIQSQPQEIINLLTTYYGSDLKKVKSALSEVERISNIMLDILNTMAIQQGLNLLSHVKYEPSVLVQEAESLYLEKVKHAQQLKTERQRKNKE